MKRTITLIGVLLLLVSPALGGKKTGGTWTVTLGNGSCDEQFEGDYLSGSNSSTAGRACSAGWSFGVNAWDSSCVAFDPSYWLKGANGDWDVLGDPDYDDIELTVISLRFEQDPDTGAITSMMGYFQDGAPGTHIKDRNRYEADTEITFNPPLPFNCEQRNERTIVVNSFMVVVPSKGPRIPVGEVHVGSITFVPNQN